MEKALERVLKMYYWNPEGFKTDEFYDDYLQECLKDGIYPRPKSIIIRDICKEFGLKVKSIKYFVKE